MGLHPRALANAEGDSIQWELGLLAVRRGVAHRRGEGKQVVPRKEILIFREGKRGIGGRLVK